MATWCLCFLCAPNRMHGILHTHTHTSTESRSRNRAHTVPERKRTLHRINAIYTSANDVNVHIVAATEELQLSNGVIKMWNVWCACIFSLSPRSPRVSRFSLNFFLMDQFAPQHTTFDGEFFFFIFSFYFILNPFLCWLIHIVVLFHAFEHFETQLYLNILHRKRNETRIILRKV